MKDVARLFAIAALALLASGAATGAEPVKSKAPNAPQPQRSAEVVLASAGPVQSPAPANQMQSSAPAKRRVARVTTCRCGDPQPEPETQDQ